MSCLSNSDFINKHDLFEKFKNEIATQITDFEESLRFRKNKIEANLDQTTTELAEKILQKLFHDAPKISPLTKAKMND